MFKINLCHRDEILGRKVDCFAVRFDDQSLSRGREKRENVKGIEEEEREAFFFLCICDIQGCFPLLLPWLQRSVLTIPNKLI